MKTKQEELRWHYYLPCHLQACLVKTKLNKVLKHQLKRKFSVSTTYYSFLNFGEEKTNTHHYEFTCRVQTYSERQNWIKGSYMENVCSYGYANAGAIKFERNNFYPGRLRETGIGITYQRMIWKGLFATVEVLPQLKTYIDKNDKKIGNGFKLYTSYHLGYHISLFKDRVYIEPQIHCNYWPIDTNTPQGFKEIDNKWNNYFLFEPNLYIGFKF